MKKAERIVTEQLMRQARALGESPDPEIRIAAAKEELRFSKRLGDSIAKGAAKKEGEKS